MDLSSVSVDLSTIFTLGVTIVTALVGLGVVRKAIKFSNRW